LTTLAAPLAADFGWPAVWLTPLFDDETTPSLRAARHLRSSSAAPPTRCGTATFARELSPDVLELDGADHGLARSTRRSRWPTRSPPSRVAAGLSRPTLDRVQQTLDVSNAVAAELAGISDGVLDALKERLKCTVRLRGNQLTLEGDETHVSDARVVIDELVEWSRRPSDRVADGRRRPRHARSRPGRA